jgi:hypothetical protein
MSAGRRRRVWSTSCRTQGTGAAGGPQITPPGQACFLLRAAVGGSKFPPGRFAQLVRAQPSHVLGSKRHADLGRSSRVLGVGAKVLRCITGAEEATDVSNGEIEHRLHLSGLTWPLRLNTPCGTHNLRNLVGGTTLQTLSAVPVA